MDQPAFERCESWVVARLPASALGRWSGEPIRRRTWYFENRTRRATQHLNGDASETFEDHALSTRRATDRLTAVFAVKMRCWPSSDARQRPCLVRRDGRVQARELGPFVQAAMNGCGHA
jgi:hypothetical protein